jgi:hypothetical protein
VCAQSEQAGLVEAERSQSNLHALEPNVYIRQKFNNKVKRCKPLFIYIICNVCLPLVCVEHIRFIRGQISPVDGTHFNKVKSALINGGGGAFGFVLARALLRARDLSSRFPLGWPDQIFD